MHDLMNWVLNRAAEAIWDSAGYVVTEKGETDLSPTKEAKWQKSKPAQPWLRNQHIFLPSMVAQEALPGTHSLQGRVRNSRLK